MTQGYKMRKLFFSLLIFILLLLIFEIILSLGGYFYFYIYSNLEDPKIEKDSFRILFFGESTTEGAGVKNTYSIQIEKILQQKYSDKKIKCYNKGIGAVETTAILRNLDRNMIKYKPHLVILMAGANDGISSDDVKYKLSFLERLYSNLRVYRFIVFFKDAPLLVAGMPDDVGFRYIHPPLNDTPRFYIPYYKYKSVCRSKEQTLSNFDKIIQTVKSYDSKIWLAGYLQPDFRKRMNPVLEEVAKENNITYVGNYPEVDFKINSSLFTDGWHPSEEGHRIIAEKIAERILQEGIIDHWNPKGDR